MKGSSKISRRHFMKWTSLAALTGFVSSCRNTLFRSEETMSADTEKKLSAASIRVLVQCQMDTGHKK